MLPPDSRSAILSACDTVELPHEFVLYQAAQTPTHAHFLTSGLAKMVTMMADGTCAESGLVGREGVPEALHVLGPSQMLPRCSIQVPATASRITFTKFQDFFSTHTSFRQALLRFVQYEALITGQIATCNSLHEVEPRLARWLLMIRDRVTQPELPVTHECMARMLGASRSTISTTAAKLQASGLIRYHRGNVTIVERRGLERRACECYAVTARLLSDLGK